jgi:hypothetical protein
LSGDGGVIREMVLIGIWREQLSEKKEVAKAYPWRRLLLFLSDKLIGGFSELKEESETLLSIGEDKTFFF